ncbi:MAG: hypothetical protein JO149_06640 [Gammaproteobacteria bacterium]|nr:hypothetical protein [Gammaproteobacteria bacterium]
MPYITREDGERFVIPSYRDVLTTKNKTQLKKDIFTLSHSYGEYITMQKNSATQYEMAFSSDTGYLLGESVWQHFNRPMDMVYCEAIPNTTEAILVIVKSGSVYLDGSFPLDSITEELIIFLTQQNNFEIYIYGDVPISQIPTGGKFSFDASSVKSFTVLDHPVFASLPLLKTYQLQLVEVVLKAHGIGEVPYKPIIGALVVLAVIGLGWYFMTMPKEIAPAKLNAPPEVNPYQGFYDALQTPAPEKEINAFINKLPIFFGMPGWYPDKIFYSHGGIMAQVRSTGGSIENLHIWAKNNKATVIMQNSGFAISLMIDVENRSKPQMIYPLKKTIEAFIDKIAQITPGNNLRLKDFSMKDPFSTVDFSISFEGVTPPVIALIGDQFREMPFTLQSVSIESITNGIMSGSINLTALGS